MVEITFYVCLCGLIKIRFADVGRPNNVWVTSIHGLGPGSNE